MNPASLTPSRRPLWFRLARGLFFTVLTLATLLALLWAFENWRGERQWQALVKSYAAKGDPLDFFGTSPATVTDDQNVTISPLLKPLLEYDVVKGEPVWRDTNGIARLDALKLPGLGAEENKGSDGRTPLARWQTAFRATNSFPLPSTAGTPAADILAALSLWKPELDELETATRRPYARFIRNYTQEDIGSLLPQLSRGKAISRILQLRCAARLAAGDTDGALADIELNERWAHALGSDPLLINQLVVIALETIGTGMAWEGLTDHRWNESQLQRLQALFAARTPREDLLRALRGERTFGLSMMDLWIRNPEPPKPVGGNDAPQSPFPRGLPRGWVRQNQITLVRLHELLAEHIGAHHSHHGSETNIVPQLKRERPWFYSQLTTALAPALIKAGAKVDRLLTISRMAEIACGLERYRLAHQAYPESLDALIPDLLKSLPLDPCTAKPFQYQRVPDGSFRLFSLGPNGRDDGGVFVPDDEKSDWLWPLSTETPKRMF